MLRKLCHTLRGAVKWTFSSERLGDKASRKSSAENYFVAKQNARDVHGGAEREATIETQWANVCEK